MQVGWASRFDIFQVRLFIFWHQECRSNNPMSSADGLRAFILYFDHAVHCPPKALNPPTNGRVSFPLQESRLESRHGLSEVIIRPVPGVRSWNPVRKQTTHSDRNISTDASPVLEAQGVRLSRGGPMSYALEDTSRTPQTEEGCVRARRECAPQLRRRYPPRRPRLTLKEPWRTTFAVP